MPMEKPKPRVIDRPLHPVLNTPCPVCAVRPEKVVPVVVGGEPWGFPFFGHWKQTPVRVVCHQWLPCGHDAAFGVKPIAWKHPDGSFEGHWIPEDQHPDIWYHERNKIKSALADAAQEARA
jgi:hypothetical protein